MERQVRGDEAGDREEIDRTAAEQAARAAIHQPHTVRRADEAYQRAVRGVPEVDRGSEEQERDEQEGDNHIVREHAEVVSGAPGHDREAPERADRAHRQRRQQPDQSAQGRKQDTGRLGRDDTGDDAGKQRTEKGRGILRAGEREERGRQELPSGRGGEIPRRKVGGNRLQSVAHGIHRGSGSRGRGDTRDETGRTREQREEARERAGREGLQPSGERRHRLRADVHT